MTKDEIGDVALYELEELVYLSLTGGFGLLLETEGFPEDFCLVELICIRFLEFAFFCEGPLGGVGWYVFHY